MFRKWHIPKGALYILEVLQNNGHKAYLVGGCVRDLMLGGKPSEWDITTDAPPAVSQRLFLKVIPTGIDFGTVTIILDDGSYEVTTFRSDEKYSDGRHPDRVTFTKTLESDLARRDFTVNAMAYDPFTRKTIDVFNGRKDLSGKVLRAVGDPLVRFSEDHLRPVRACRFAAKLRFRIEEHTLKAISDVKDSVSKVAPERIHDEIVKMLSSDKPSIGIEYMRTTGLLGVLIPELDACFGVEQPKEFHKFDVYWHSLHSCDMLPRGDHRLRLAGLLHDISKPECKVAMTFYNHDQKGGEVAESVLRRLKFSRADIDHIVNLIRNHMFNYTPEWSDSAVRRFMRRVGTENIDDLFALRRADMLAMRTKRDGRYLSELKKRIDRVLSEENALHVDDLKVNGNDVMSALSIGPGPKVGEALNFLLERVLDEPKLNARDELLRLLKEFKG